MKASLVFALILIVAVYSLVCVLPCRAASFGIIYIKPDGSIDPSTAPIWHKGDAYYLSNELYNSPIILERNNVIFDGKGHTSWGLGKSVGLNLTCSNVTVNNLSAVNWDAGILGAYNNNTIQNCTLTDNEKGIAIYADNYGITGNAIVSNGWGIRMQANNVTVSYNQLVGNGIGMWISSSQGAYSGNVITSNTFDTDGHAVIETDLGGEFSVYHNNFIVFTNQSLIITAYLVVPGDETKVVMPPWDNGKEGNYWSNYAAKYPNATETGNIGIYDTPYTINIAPNLTDRYPLTKQIDTTTNALPTPSSSPTPLPNPTTNPNETPTISTAASPASPSPTIPELPAWAFLVVLAASACLAALLLTKRHVEAG